MARLEERLLAAEEAVQEGRSSGTWRQRFHVRVLLAAVVPAFAVAAFICGRHAPQWPAAHGVSLNLVSGTSQNATALAAGLDSDCYTYTGGTCGVNPCYSWRDAECQDGYCLCTGTCSGADGKCYHGLYKQVAAGFTLTNVKYNRQKMYMPATAPLDTIKTTQFPSSLNGGKDKFVLHRLPGSLAGHAAYFLSTERFPDFVAAIRATAGTALSPFGAYEIGLAQQFGPERLAVRICSKGGGKVMIGGFSPLGNTEWFYVHHFSWIVYGWGFFYKPGNAGVWQADPAIPEDQLLPCD